jgi:hypothetical protein
VCILLCQDKGPLLHVLIEWLTRSFDTEEHGKDVFATIEAVILLLCAIIRNSYDVTTKNEDGYDALTLLAQSVCGYDCVDWPVRLADALLDRGADVNARSNNGRTPLIHWALYGGSARARGLVLLLQRGADIDAHDNRGDTVVHALAGSSSFDALSALAVQAEAGWLLAADLSLRNTAGDTPLQIAQRQLAGYPCELKRQVTCDLLDEHASLWTARARPLLHQWLSYSLLIPDVASIVLSFVDGKERGQ